jgi:hypothetical protein
MPNGFRYQPTDYLIDMNHGSGGGGVLLPVSENFDLNNQFTMTISAPAGERFLVQPPAGQTVHLLGNLEWTSPFPSSAAQFGGLSVTFGNLDGAAPVFSDQQSLLTANHELFGLSLQAVSITSAFSFSSITLTASLPATATGQGTISYTPELESFLVFYFQTNQSIDPGSFVFLVPEPSIAAFLLVGVWALVCLKGSTASACKQN